MNNYISAFFASLLLVFSGVVFSQDNSGGKQLPKFRELPLEEIDKFATSAPLFIKDYSLAAIRHIGKIIKEETKKSPNLHDQTKINLEKIFYFDGLEINGLIVVDQSNPTEKDSHTVLLRAVTVTDGKWKILDGLTVGTQVERLMLVLGTPHEDINGTIKYAGTTEEIQFFTKQNKIEKIQFIYYLD